MFIFLRKIKQSISLRQQSHDFMFFRMVSISYLSQSSHIQVKRQLIYHSKTILQPSVFQFDTLRNDMNSSIETISSNPSIRFSLIRREIDSLSITSSDRNLSSSTSHTINISSQIAIKNFDRNTMSIEKISRSKTHRTAIFTDHRPALRFSRQLVQ